ncbi:MAG: VIT1/CCC1 transporter family protein [Candidatus Rokubacteria bacterium]|nr:VIT1/CCC1 transporter family protein [Candidatus Rokubacteria bacterium]
MAPTGEKREEIRWLSQIREVVFGMQDGLISTVGFVAGVHGATADNRLVLLAGIVQMIAGAFSMAAGAYLSTKAEREVVEGQVRSEYARYADEPYMAQEALLGSLEADGLPRDKAYRVVKLISAERDAFLRTFREKVLGVGAAQERVPVPAALLMGFSFAIGAIIVLAPYFVLAGYGALWTAAGLTAVALFGIGVAQAVLAGTRLLVSGLEFLLVAAAAAGVGYLLGRLLPPGFAA